MVILGRPKSPEFSKNEYILWLHWRFNPCVSSSFENPQSKLLTGERSNRESFIETYVYDWLDLTIVLRQNEYWFWRISQTEDAYSTTVCPGKFLQWPSKSKMVLLNLIECPLSVGVTLPCLYDITWTSKPILSKLTGHILMGHALELIRLWCTYGVYAVCAITLRESTD